MASTSFLALRSLPRLSGANGSVSMKKTIITNLIFVARKTGRMPDYLRRIIKYQYGRKCTLCKAFIDIRLQQQPHYRPIRLSDVPDPPSQPSDDDDEPRHRPFHMDCWWIYQRDTANKKRRLRYHAKQPYFAVAEAIATTSRLRRRCN